MSSFQNQKAVVPQLGVVATDATSATTQDTLGFKRCIVDVIHNKASNASASAKWTSLVLQHGSTTDVSNFTAIANMTGTTQATATTAQFVLGEHNDTVVGSITRFFVDLTGKERFLRVLRQASASYHSTATTFQLFRAGSSPDSDTERGVVSSVAG